MNIRAEQAAEWVAVKNAVFAIGVCPECRARFQAPARSLCASCLRKARLRQRVRIAYQGKKRCGICRRKGHDRRTCTSPKAVSYWDDGRARKINRGGPKKRAA